jgi:hypothetical protein
LVVAEFIGAKQLDRYARFVRLGIARVGDRIAEPVSQRDLFDRRRLYRIWSGPRASLSASQSAYDRHMRL